MAQNINPAQGASAAQPKAVEITDQATLTQALEEGNAEQTDEAAQPESSKKEETQVSKDQPKEVEHAEDKEKKPQEAPKRIFGIFDDMGKAEKSYKGLYSYKTKLEQEIKELKKSVREMEISEVKNSEYDKQMEYLLEQNRKLQEMIEEKKERDTEDFPPPTESKPEEKPEVTERKNQENTVDQEVVDFIKTKPLLEESGFADEFYLIATHPKYQTIKLDDIYSQLIEPKLKKWAGTKVTVKERPLRTAKTPEPSKPKDVSQMSNTEYEKNREEVLRAAGVQI